MGLVGSYKDLVSTLRKGERKSLDKLWYIYGLL